jgi:hypothetical protein
MPPEAAQERALEAIAISRGEVEGSVDATRGTLCERHALVMLARPRGKVSLAARHPRR